MAKKQTTDNKDITAKIREFAIFLKSVDPVIKKNVIISLDQNKTMKALIDGWYNNPSLGTCNDSSDFFRYKDSYVHTLFEKCRSSIVIIRQLKAGASYSRELRLMSSSGNTNKYCGSSLDATMPAFVANLDEVKKACEFLLMNQYYIISKVEEYLKDNPHANIELV